MKLAYVDAAPEIRERAKIELANQRIRIECEHTERSSDWAHFSIGVSASFPSLGITPRYSEYKKPLAFAEHECTHCHGLLLNICGHFDCANACWPHRRCWAQ